MITILSTGESLLRVWLITSVDFENNCDREEPFRIWAWKMAPDGGNTLMDLQVNDLLLTSDKNERKHLNEFLLLNLQCVA